MELRFWKKPGLNPGEVGEPDTNKEQKSETITCRSCGAEVEADASFCTRCSAPLGKKGKKRIEAAEAVGGLKPWAVKAGAWFAAIPRRVKVRVLLAVVVIVALIVVLSVVAAGHSPSAAVERYLTLLKQGDFRGAYELVANPGGRFSSFE